MPTGVNIIVVDNGIHAEPFHVRSQFFPARVVPVTTTDPQQHGVFKAVTSTTQTTTEIVAPLVGGSIVLTDLIISSNKAANGILTLRFTDGPNTINIAVFPVDIAIVMPIALVGLFRGWEDARLEMVTTVATFDATVTAGYMKVTTSLPFAAWDALR